jgi:hypothetical protein
MYIDVYIYIVTYLYIIHIYIYIYYIHIYIYISGTPPGTSSARHTQQKSPGVWPGGGRSSSTSNLRALYVGVVRPGTAGPHPHPKLEDWMLVSCVLPQANPRARHSRYGADFWCNLHYLSSRNPPQWLPWAPRSRKWAKARGRFYHLSSPRSAQ